MRSLLGTLLSGRYRLDAQIGAGGMSTVYRAHDEVLERTVAIKLLNHEIAHDSDQLARFRREARAVARLAHPHIVGVIDAGEDEHNGRPYIVFEYVHGETLKERIRRAGWLPIPEAVAYAIEIARALGFAHARQIVHRDVKPQNVLIDGEGSARVTDFGIARSLDEVGLTAEGRVLGTTDYVSPEQALGHAVTGQSDLYSLGIVLYEMLTGDVPFHGDNQVAVAMKHVRQPMPDVQILRGEVSAALAAVVDRATAKDLRRRYPSATEMIAELEDALALETARAGQATGEATSVLRTLPEPKRRRLPLRLRTRPVWLALIVLAVLGAAVVGALKLWHHAQSGTGSEPAGAAPELRAVSLAQSAAHDYDPLGDDRREHSESTGLVLDRDPSTYWTTSRYQGGNWPPGKSGVGIYVDAAPRVRARALTIRTPSPGWSARIYGAPPGPPPARLADWLAISPERPVTRTQKRFDLSTDGRALRYYLVWITSLPSSGQVSIAEISLFQGPRRQ